MRVALLPFLVLSAMLSACSSLSGPPAGLGPGGQLQPCPSAPRCVSSQAAAPGVAPLRLRDGSPSTWTAVAEAVEALPRSTLVSVQDHYLHAEIISPWGLYTDDLELLRAPDAQTVQLRSSARVGYYDFGVNRDRVAALRARLDELGLLAAPD